MTIRTAHEEDIPRLAGLIKDAFRDVAEKFGITQEESGWESPFCTPEVIRADMNDGMVYHLLEDDAILAGCIAVGDKMPGILYAKRLAVPPHLRGRGYGRMLMNHLVEEARRLGKDRVGSGHAR